MFAYVIRRLFLMIPTLFGIMLITFTVTQFVPGGPVERMIAEIEGTSKGGEVSLSSSALYQGSEGLDAERIEQIKSLYGFDKPGHRVFLVRGGGADIYIEICCTGPCLLFGKLLNYFFVFIGDCLLNVSEHSINSFSNQYHDCLLYS